MNRIKEPKELIERAIAEDDPELIPDMYDDNDWRADMQIKEMCERWDR